VVLDVVVCIECEVQNKIDVDFETDSLAEVVLGVNLGVDFGLDLEFWIDIELQVFPADIEVYMEVRVHHKLFIDVEVGNIQIVVLFGFLSFLVLRFLFMLRLMLI
jgi:hypothetical protein